MKKHKYERMLDIYILLESGKKIKKRTWRWNMMWMNELFSEIWIIFEHTIRIPL